MSIILYHGCKISNCFYLQQIMMEKVGSILTKIRLSRIKHTHKKNCPTCIGQKNKIKIKNHEKLFLFNCIFHAAVAILVFLA